MTEVPLGAESRLPNPMTRVPGLGAIGRELAQAVGSLPTTIVSLAQLRVGQILESDYLVALHAGNLRRAGEGQDRLDAVAQWRRSDLFTDREQVALALAEALLTERPGEDRVSDDLYLTAARAFGDTELATLAIALGQVFFYVPLALIGKPVAGVPGTEQWRP